MREPARNPVPSQSDPSAQDCLASWKEIATYLQRDISTVRRWEHREGMPVHRHVHEKRGSVYAFRFELDEWIRSRKVDGDGEAGPGSTDTSRVPAIFDPPFLRQRGLLYTAVALAVLAASAYVFISRGALSSAPQIRSIVVLPLQNLSGDPTQEYFADGMTEALIGSLSTIRGLRVISRTSSMQFKGKTQSLPEIAAALRVDAVIEGSVIRSGNRVRVNAQLIRAATDAHLWSARYDRELRDILSLQTEVASAIARQAEITISGAPPIVSPRSDPVSPEAYEAYLRGRFALNAKTPERIRESIGFFETAAVKDPSFALAFSGLASAHSALALVFVGAASPLEERPKAIAAARRALELNPNLAEAHVVLADALQKQWQWKQAEAECRNAIQLDPNFAPAYVGLGHWLLCQGRQQEAIAAAQRGGDLDPLGLYGVDLGWILFSSRQYQDAIRELRSVLAVEPEHIFALTHLGYALVADGQIDEGIRVLEKAASVSRRGPGVLGGLARAYAAAGRRADALRLLDELHQQQRRNSYVPAAAFINVYVGLGEHEQAFVWLERAYREHSNMLQFVKVHPTFDPLRNDPRFADCIRRVHQGY
jgi:TolB-like protein/tetratricopeptide (TPR) repeat protein